MIAVSIGVIRRATVAMLPAGIVGAYTGSSMVGANPLARDVALRVVADGEVADDWMLWRLGSRISAEDCAPWRFR